MNKERFNKLKDEAFQTTEWEDRDYDKILERIVELTVRECDALCQKHARDHAEKMMGIGHVPTEQVVARKMGLKIKEHFGVEE